MHRTEKIRSVPENERRLCEKSIAHGTASASRTRHLCKENVRFCPGKGGKSVCIPWTAAAVLWYTDDKEKQQKGENGGAFVIQAADVFVVRQL